jgi:hypothetical protein
LLIFSLEHHNQQRKYQRQSAFAAFLPLSLSDKAVKMPPQSG